jgi:hypothetical protein
VLAWGGSGGRHGFGAPMDGNQARTDCCGAKEPSTPRWLRAIKWWSWYCQGSTDGFLRGMGEDQAGEFSTRLEV